MNRCRNEEQFSHVLVLSLRHAGCFVQRIESGQVGRGIPDIYMITPKHHAFWLELKRVHEVLTGQEYCQIPWRPGQQAWLSGVSRRGQQAHTLAMFDDFIVQIPHGPQPFPDNLVSLKGQVAGLGLFANIRDLVHDLTNW